MTGIAEVEDIKDGLVAPRHPPPNQQVSPASPASPASPDVFSITVIIIMNIFWFLQN